jgi:hypothetical protein
VATSDAVFEIVAALPRNRGKRVAVPPDRDTSGIEDLGEPTRNRVRRPRTLALMPAM